MSFSLPIPCAQFDEIAVSFDTFGAPGIPAVTKSSNFDHLQQDLDLFSWNFTAQDAKLGLEQAL